MINILIAEDNSIKVKNIRDILDKIPELGNYDISSDLISVKKNLSINHYDLLILDLNLPHRIGDDPLPENGGNFLSELDKGNRLIKPAHIIGLSAFDKSIESFKDKFDSQLWALIKYDATSNNWAQSITNKIIYLVNSKRDMINNSNKTYIYDLAIITALRNPELESILNLAGNWESFKVNNDPTEYYKGKFIKEDKIINVVAASATQMGMVASSLLSNKLIMNFRPKIIAMTGIAGGVKGVGNLGDILAADISYDSGSGKIKTDSKGDSHFEPDYKSINLNIDLKELLLEYKNNRDLLYQIKKNWVADKPQTELNIHIGPLASGAGVIENNKVIDEIKGHNRKLIGIDMETYGVFYAATNCSKPRPISVISLKSISDYADPDKNDNFQKYASYTSANFLYNFALEKISFE